MCIVFPQEKIIWSWVMTNSLRSLACKSWESEILIVAGGERVGCHSLTGADGPSVLLLDECLRKMN